VLLRNAYGSGVPVLHRTPPVEWTNTNPLRFRLLEQKATAGVSVTAESAFGLPTFLECVRQPAVLIASLDWGSWDWTQPAVPALDSTSWLAELLDFPGFGSKFDLFQDVSSSIDGWGGALIQKVKGVGTKDRGRVQALRVVDPDKWQVKVEKGKRVFKVKTYDMSTGSKREETWTEENAIYIRGFNPLGFLAGVIPWQIFRESLGNGIAIESFSSNWWKNQGAISTYISHPEKLSPTQAEEILDVYEETHGGLDNAGRPALLSGGAKLEMLRLSVADAQLEASRNWTVSDVCRMLNWAPELVTVPSGSGLRYITEELVLKVQKMYLQPRARRIRDAFNADPDLFKGNKFWLDVRYDPIEAPDASTRAAANLSNRQAGIVTANELRIPMGLPPRDDGDSLQMTPVGGAPNDEPAATSDGAAKGNKAPSTGYDPEGAPADADETN